MLRNAHEKIPGAQKRTRTSTPLRELRPERSASTNSAIWARGRKAAMYRLISGPSTVKLSYLSAQLRVLPPLPPAGRTQARQRVTRREYGPEVEGDAQAKTMETRSQKTANSAGITGISIGAGRRNRTDIHSLEGWCITIMLYPPSQGFRKHLTPSGAGGGGDRIRTCVRYAGRFTVCCL